MITRNTIKLETLKSISWRGDKVIDWANSGKTIALDGSITDLGAYYFAYRFDTAITSQCGTYAFIYKRLGTKGLLLKNGKELRESNRSYYHAEVYEYPAAFISLPGGRTLLAHCPAEYCRIDFEEVETGEILTASADRNPADCFHSRLEVSPDNKYLLSKGWYWHPWSSVEVFDIATCLANPALLDKGAAVPQCGSEVNTAGFTDEENVLIGSSTEEPLDGETDSLPPGYLAIWNVRTNQVSKAVKVQGEFGNIFPIDEYYSWDTFRYPKVIDLKTGEIVGKVEDVATGEQNSAIIWSEANNLQKIAYDRNTKQLAIRQEGVVEILGWTGF